MEAEAKQTAELKIRHLENKCTALLKHKIINGKREQTTGEKNHYK